jgi:hypothetical protein
MGKRSKFERREMNFYPTPFSAVAPLLFHLPKDTTFCEPCAGEGHLIRHLESAGHKCVSAFDAGNTPYRRHDASFMVESDLEGADCVITNPPWDRKPMHQIISRGAMLRPTWLLFDADWMHTAQAAPYLQMCRKIISVGRVKWIEDSASVGMDNCCWYLFEAQGAPHVTTFHGQRG